MTNRLFLSWGYLDADPLRSVTDKVTDQFDTMLKSLGSLCISMVFEVCRCSYFMKCLSYTSQLSLLFLQGLLQHCLVRCPTLALTLVSGQSHLAVQIWRESKKKQKMLLELSFLDKLTSSSSSVGFPLFSVLVVK